MFNRRNFIKGSAVASAASVCAAGAPCLTAAEADKNPSGVGGYSYRLPGFKKGTRLLFQGDSITDMKWGRNQKDRNHYLGHSYVYLLAARLGVEMPEAQLDFYNRGMSGHKVADLKKRWKKDAVDMKPDLLSILIGINDVGRNRKSGVDLKAWEADYRSLLVDSRKANADLRIVLLDPFVLEKKNMRLEVDKLCPIVAKLASEFNAVHIKTQQVFDIAAKTVGPKQWIWDGVHPLPQGHELIARNWLQQVSARWPQK